MFIPAGSRAMKVIPIIGLALVVVSAEAGSTNRVTAFTLPDQFDQRHAISFPRARTCVMLIGDREGSRQLDDWTKAIAEKSGDSVDICGLADLREVPRPIRAWIRNDLKKQHAQPVLLDWDGKVAVACGYAGKRALVLVIDRQGEILHRATGKADAVKLEQLFRTITGEDDEAVSVCF
jgi:hypothetical protein